MVHTPSTAHLLRELRRQRGSSLRTAAAEIGIAPSQLSRLERGHRRVTPEVAEELSAYYGESPERILLSLGDVPADVIQILAAHPELIDELRGRFTVSAVEGVYRLRPSWIPRYRPDVYVPCDLDTLDGPTAGRHDPPVELYWQPGALDFDDLGDVALFYSSALTSASTREQFTQWIHRGALIAVWNKLSLSATVRVAWETIHPALRDEAHTVNDRTRVQDVILTAVAEHGFALAGGSALIDYDVVSRDTDDIDAFSNRWDAAVFNAAHDAVIRTCQQHGWSATTTLNEDFRKQIVVDTGSGAPVEVDIVFYERSQNPEPRAGGGLRLVFADVAGGKGVAVAEVARGRDFFDLASIIDTPGWSVERIEEAMAAMKYADMVVALRVNLQRFRSGDFDDDIRRSGFDPGFCHRLLD